MHPSSGLGLGWTLGPGLLRAQVPCRGPGPGTSLDPAPCKDILFLLYVYIDICIYIHKYTYIDLG